MSRDVRHVFLECPKHLIKYDMTGFFPGKYCRAVSLLKIEFSFPLRPRSGRGQEVKRISPGIVLNFTPSRPHETASPVLKTVSVDTVFTFYYAREMQPATLNRTFRAVLHIQRPFYFISFIFFFWKIEFRNTM